jgi:hypothetical protein
MNVRVCWSSYDLPKRMNTNSYQQYCCEGKVPGFGSVNMNFSEYPLDVV